MTDSKETSQELVNFLSDDPDEAIGYATGMNADGTVNVRDDKGNSINAIAATPCVSAPTLVERVNGTWYAFQSPNQVTSDRVAINRRLKPVVDTVTRLYKEVLDINNVLKGKKFQIAQKTVKLQAKLLYKIFSTKKLKNFTDVKEVVDTTLIENKNLFVAYSDTAYLSSGQYRVRIGERDKVVNANNQQNKQLSSKDNIYVTNCTPFRLYSFISNKNTNPRTNLSFLFNNPLPQLKRDLKKYNKNCYYAWVLREISDVQLIYGYGWVNPEGKLIPTKINYEQDLGCYLNNSFVFISANEYDGHMAIDIGCFDRTKQVAKIVNGVKTYIYIPLILLPEPDPYSFVMDAEVDSSYVIAQQVSAITELQGIYIASDPQWGDWGNYYSNAAASLFNAINSTIDYVSPQNNP